MRPFLTKRRRPRLPRSVLDHWDRLVMNQKQLTAPDSRACRITRQPRQICRTRQTLYQKQKDPPAATTPTLPPHLRLAPAPTAETSSQYSTSRKPRHLQKERPTIKLRHYFPGRASTARTTAAPPYPHERATGRSRSSWRSRRWTRRAARSYESTASRNVCPRPPC